MNQISNACGGGYSGRALVPGSLRGYRTWRLASRFERVPDGMLPLTSVTRRDVCWTPTMHATCTPEVGPPSRRRPVSPSLRSDHTAPDRGCKCGIYAWYEPDDTAMLRARVFGVIEASGLVLMGERGFRAERARIVAVVTRRPRVAAACARAGIAVYRRRRDLIRDHPPEDVSSLIGPRPAPAAPIAPPVPPRPLDGFDRTLLIAVWARTAILLAAAFVLPVMATVVTALAAELALIGLIVNRVHV